MERIEKLKKIMLIYNSNRKMANKLFKMLILSGEVKENQLITVEIETDVTNWRGPPKMETLSCRGYVRKRDFLRVIEWRLRLKLETDLLGSTVYAYNLMCNMKRLNG